MNRKKKMNDAYNKKLKKHNDKLRIINKPKYISKEPLKYSQIFGKIAQSKTVGENHEPIDLC